ncbi:trypco2 family protein [Actinomadura roseirufa]|uniref:trypco2 family protein n=1 Tax=Actinomadura roseirufa TaxID=2094049 RepID=UPI0010414976|nr:trypco2 family protein [Actinomadura roseirufa]
MSGSERPERVTGLADGPPAGAFELADVVEAVRGQLARAATADGKGLKFEVGDVELEFTVVLTSEAKANAGVKVWVLSAGASAGYGEAVTQRIKVALKPVDERTGRPPRISDKVQELPPD